MYFLLEPSLNHLAFIIRHITSNSIHDIRVDSSIILPKLPDFEHGAQQFLTTGIAQSFLFWKVTLGVQTYCQTLCTIINDLGYLTLILQFLISCDSFPCNRGIHCLRVGPQIAPVTFRYNAELDAIDI